MKVVLAFDQGTTSSRAILFDRSGHLLGVAQREFTQHFPQPGWVEHDAIEIWKTQLDVGREVLQSCGFTADDVAAIGITNQRETTVLWDRATGQPLHHAIVWQDRRTSDVCSAMEAAGHSDRVQRLTGLRIDSYFCATKLKWLLDNISGARSRAEKGELAFGTIDSWLIWNLTKGRVHATDITNASRTMLLNLETGDWDSSLLELFEIPESVLPTVRSCSDTFGETDSQWFGGAIQIGGSAGDQQSALFGQNCTENGMAKNTYGTGCFMLMNVGDQPMISQSKLLATAACSLDRNRQYALEGSVFVAGAAVGWLRDGLGIIDSSDQVEPLAASVPDSGDVYMVPAFAGLGAPQWDSYARGTIVGLTRGTTRAHIARATLESIAFQVADVFDAMKQDAGFPISELRVDGGACANNLLMQFQADIMNTPVVRPTTIETTAMGAAFLAGLSVGFWEDLHEIQSIWATDRVFEPTMSRDEAHSRRSRWNDALGRSLSWAEKTEKGS